LTNLSNPSAGGRSAFLSLAYSSSFWVFVGYASTRCLIDGPKPSAHATVKVTTLHMGMLDVQLSPTCILSPLAKCTGTDRSQGSWIGASTSNRLLDLSYLMTCVPQYSMHGPKHDGLGNKRSIDRSDLFHHVSILSLPETGSNV
jgi:hypothetical protein